MQTLSLTEVLKHTNPDWLNNPDQIPLVQVLNKLPKLDENVWIAGGAIRRLILGERRIESDIDFFFPSEYSLRSYLEKILPDIEDPLNTSKQFIESTEFKIVEFRENDMNSSVKVKMEIVTGVASDTGHEFKKEIEVQLQLIRIYAPSPLETIALFDFSICQCAMDHKDMIHLGDWTLWDIARKRLSVNKITYPTASVRRILKYKDQGYTICSGSITELLLQVAQQPTLVNPAIVSVD